MKTYFNGRIVVQSGDITTVDVDAVVNAANSNLMGGGGVDGAIHKKGGPDILEECKEIRTHRYPEGLPAGKAVMTGAGKLPAQYVIHTVGPVWNGGNNGEDRTLAEAYVNSLSLASETGLKTIAFPAISTGVYGFPKQKAAEIAYREISEFLSSHNLPTTVYLVFFGESDEQIFIDTIATEGLE
jgi:O-acetyl-ADP-ribose deacetylase (regulator of RNase III)